MSRTALVVGASRGIGLGLAKEFAARGWNVIATARDPAGATELAAAAKAAGSRITVEQADVDAVGTIEALDRLLGDRRLDVVVVNAGTWGPQHQSIETVTADELQALMTTNVLGPIRTAKRLLHRVTDGGIVSFMSSRMGSIADNTSGGADLYRMSKSALNMLTRGFALNDVRDRPIEVIDLHPGWVRTAMGGPNATLSVEESVTGLVTVLEKTRGPGHRYLNYDGSTIPW